MLEALKSKGRGMEYRTSRCDDQRYKERSGEYYVHCGNFMSKNDRSHLTPPRYQKVEALTFLLRSEPAIAG